MAATNHVTVALMREHRDAIYDEVESIVDSAGDFHMYLRDAAHDENDREWMTTMTWRLTVATRLLDELGWQEHGDRSAYQLTVDRDVARFMEGLERASRGALDDERKALAARPNDRWAYVPTKDEWERDRAATRDLMDVYLDGIDAARIAQAAFGKAMA